MRRYHRFIVPTLPQCNKRVARVPLPSCNTVFANRSYDYYAPMLYNKLNKDINKVKKTTNYQFQKAVIEKLQEFDYEATESLFLRIE